MQVLEPLRGGVLERDIAPSRHEGGEAMRRDAMRGLSCLLGLDGWFVSGNGFFLSVRVRVLMR